MNNSENKDNLKLLSVFIDNIVRDRQIFYQKYEKICGNYELMLVKSGILQLILDGKKMKLKKNTACVIKKGTRGVAYRLSDEACEITVVEFDGSGVPGMLRYLRFDERDVFGVSGNHLADMFDKMVLCYESGEYFRSAVILQSLMLAVKDTADKNHRISNLDEIYQYIQNHYAEPLDLNHLAGVYGTSVSYFSRAFKQFFDVSPMNFVNEVRIRQARVLLETTELKVHEIAERCGFEKLEYFCYVFKKYAGCTPTQYRLNRGYTGHSGGIELTDKI